jgi:hypothetical protein
MDLLPGRWKTRGYDSHFDFSHREQLPEKTSYEIRLEQQKEESQEDKEERALKKLIQSKL